MAQKEETIGITVKKSEDEWYTQVVLKAELADYSAVKGCMVIRPWGYAIWESIQQFLDANIKKRGVKNAYFPLFIPESFFKREAEHAEGFSPEVAWIANREEERLAVRPTSETVMYDSYSRWIRSWRDLPLRINQWCNVVRWETKAVKLFLRTREFLWQEGHCVYATEQEADEETLMYLKEYQRVYEELLAIPVIPGRKTDAEKFAGALYTDTIEGLMPDGKALQTCTSHNLGQNFAKAFGISFLGQDGKEHLPWQISWGLSTRTIGAVVMVHGDDKGLVLPPKIAPVQAVIVPILFEATKDSVLKECLRVKQELSDFRVELDGREEYSAGWKFNQWELKGVPIRIEIGPKDMEKKQAVLVRRDTGQKKFVRLDELKVILEDELEDMQKAMYAKALKLLEQNTPRISTWDEFTKSLAAGQMPLCPFCDEASCEKEIKEKSGASSRCKPFGQKELRQDCFNCGKPAKTLCYFAKSY